MDPLINFSILDHSRVFGLCSRVRLDQVIGSNDGLCWTKADKIGPLHLRVLRHPKHELNFKYLTTSTNYTFGLPTSFINIRLVHATFTVLYYSSLFGENVAL